MSTVVSGRLLKRAEFLRVKDAGWRVAMPCFAIQVFENIDEKGVRVGYTATTKTIGNAVQRNRARRRLKEAFKQSFSGERTGLWLVIVARAGVNEAAWDDLLGQMQKAVAKLKVKT